MVGRSIAGLPRSYGETCLPERRAFVFEAHTLKLVSPADAKVPYKLLAKNEGLLEVHPTLGDAVRRKMPKVGAFLWFGIIR